MGAASGSTLTSLVLRTRLEFGVEPFLGPRLRGVARDLGPTGLPPFCLAVFLILCRRSEIARGVGVLSASLPAVAY